MTSVRRMAWKLYFAIFILLNASVAHCVDVTCLDSNPLDTSPSYTAAVKLCFINQPISLKNNEKLTFVINGDRSNTDITTVEFLTTDASYYTDITSVPNEIFTTFPNLFNLNLTTNIQSISTADFTNAQNLAVLKLGNGLKVIPTKVFSEAKNLISLTLSNNKINNIEDNAFDGLKSLSSLDLSNNELTILKQSTFSGLSLLNTLNIDSNNIETIEDGALNLPTLKVLSLQHNKLNSISGTTFLGLNNIINILLNNNKITQVNLEVFTQLPSLNGVSLSENLIEWNNEALVENYQSSNSKLTYFDISANKLSNVDVLKKLAVFSKLVILNIQKNEFVTLDYQSKPLKEVFPNLKNVFIGENKWKCNWLNGFVAQLKSENIKATTLISLGGFKTTEVEDTKCYN